MSPIGVGTSVRDRVLRSVPAVVVAWLCAGGVAAAEVVTYPAPREIAESPSRYVAPSSEYRVEIVQDGRPVESFVYMMEALHYTNKSKTTSWTTFSFAGRVTVRVTRLRAEVSFCQILPSSRRIDVRTSGRTVEFDLDRPAQVSVEFERGTRIEHPLLVFANPIERDVPSPGDPGVTYFGPGIHDLAARTLIPSGHTVYIAGGAYVRGQFFARDGRDVTIRGRGILSGERFAARTGHYMIQFTNVDHAVVEGITLVHPPTHNIRLTGNDHLVRNVKALGWWFSTDGAQAGTNSVVEDCFFKVNDDTIMLYWPDSVARRIVIWQMENGAPFQLGWGGDNNRANGHAYDIDVIRVEHEWDNENLAVFCSIHGGPAHKHHYLFEDIRIENADWRVFHLVTRPNRWAGWDPERGSLSDITFRNIRVAGKPRLRSVVMGHDAKHPVSRVAFENVVIDDSPLTAADPGTLYVDSGTTSGIVFRPEPGTPPPPDAPLRLADIRVRDPFVLAHAPSGTYYLYASRGNREETARGVEAYTSRDLVTWTRPSTVFEVPPGFWADGAVWAPEVHEYRGRYYLFVTFTGSQPLPTPAGRPANQRRATQVLVADSPAGPFAPLGPEPQTPAAWMSLDGTLWVEDGVPFLVFCREWVQTENGTVEAMPLTADLTAPAGEPRTLFTANSAPWVRNLEDAGARYRGALWDGFVTDGPFLHRTPSGRLLMIWSSFGEKGYALGQATSESGTLAGPWTQAAAPIVAENGGHGMLFRALDGRLMLALHQPNKGPLERTRLFEVTDADNRLSLKPPR